VSERRRRSRTEALDSLVCRRPSAWTAVEAPAGVTHYSVGRSLLADPRPLLRFSDAQRLFRPSRLVGSSDDSPWSPSGPRRTLARGHVVIAGDRRSLEETCTRSCVHVRQCETWGPLFVPAYLTASLWALWRGRNFYFDNRFEVEAFQTSPSRHGAQSAVASEVTPGVTA
jgi:hypothetical protein